MDRTETSISATISGSFNKYLDQIKEKILEFEHEGIKVLSPKPSRQVSLSSGFVVLESDKEVPQEIELSHLKAISQSDFLYVVNPKGYIGKSVALEIGYALSRSIPVYSLEHPRDYVFSFFVRPEKSVRAIKQSLTNMQSETFPAKKSPTLTDLQDYVRRMVKRCGFEEETMEDVMILFIEEVGELARAIRIFTGLKASRKHMDGYESLREELADCLIYLIDLANMANIEFEDALREKEKINSRRKWRSRKA